MNNTDHVKNTVGIPRQVRGPRSWLGIPPSKTRATKLKSATLDRRNDLDDHRDHANELEKLLAAP